MEITLRDAQEAGDLVLYIKARIGELLPDHGEHLKSRTRDKDGRVTPANVEGGHHIGKLSDHQRKMAKVIAKNPKAVARAKAQAR